MTILCLSDIHCRFDVFHPAELPDAEVVLVAGDLTNNGVRRPFEIEAATQWLAALAAHYPLVFWVPGNHDIGVVPETFAGIAPNCRCLLHRQESVAGVRFYGEALTVCFDKPELANYWDYMTADPTRDQVAWQDVPAADILVSHSPPLHACDATSPLLHHDGTWERHYIGSPALLHYIERHQPRLVVCGHVHEAAGESAIGRTIVLNVAQQAKSIEMPVLS